MEKESNSYNNQNYNSFTYSYNFTNDKNGIYNIKIHPISLYYENNESLFSEKMQIFSHHLSIDINPKFYYDVQIIHNDNTPQSVYFVFDDYLNENDVLFLSFTDKCYKNEKAIECYFSSDNLIDNYTITHIIGCGENNSYYIEPPLSFNIKIEQPFMRLITPVYAYQSDLINNNVSIIADYYSKCITRMGDEICFNDGNNSLYYLRKIILRKINKNNISYIFDDIEIEDYIIDSINNKISFNVSSLEPHLYKIYSVFESYNLTMIEPGLEFDVLTYKFSLISPNEHFIYLNAPYIKFKFENTSDIDNLNTTLLFISKTVKKVKLLKIMFSYVH